MKRKVLRVLLRGKIRMEFNCFKRHILEMDPEEIWESACGIDTKIRIYGLLEEMVPVMPEEQLQGLMAFQGILDYLYEMWLTEADPYESGLKLCVVKYLAGTIPEGEACGREERRYEETGVYVKHG